MRFNDLLRTVLANMGEGTGATVTRWRQCIDLLAQYDVSGAEAAHALEAGDRDAVLELIAQMRLKVHADQRIASVAELGPRLRSAGLVRLLAQDHPSLVTLMMANVRLTDADWASIIPDLGPLARSVLRQRDDLESMALATLRQFGSVDLSLPSLVALEEVGGLTLDDAESHSSASDAIPSEMEETSQIGRIVAQIERFTEARSHRTDEPLLLDEELIAEEAAAAPEASESEPTYTPPPIDEFTFETDGAGLIRLASGAPRSAAFGLSIGMPALDSRHGADGMALGAFRRRAAFEDARFAIGDGPLEGAWRMSADPRFDRASGRFLGYVGTARREFPHEGLVRSGEGEQQGWSGLSATGARQLIHELRTPLNAIQGYAEMIEAQLMGPVSAEYREMARRILSDSRSLTDTFDDLDMASRIEHGDHRGGAPASVDLEQSLRTIIASFAQESEQRIDIFAEDDLPRIGGNPMQVERMLNHMVRAGYAALGEGERLTLRLAADPTASSVGLVMLRPRALRHIADRDLLDHGYLVDHKLRDGPPLGLAFTLKLVRGIAAHLGGAFDIAPEAFGVLLPTVSATGGEQENLR